ncbi:MAG: peptidoglycan-binding protein, partial [Acidobacteriota bacterium]|nr:peptidoglycan-binding protein [Acidobacteriota bacterium]
MRALASGAALVGALAVCGACVEPSEVPASATGDAQISSAAAPQAPAVVIEPGELAVAVERATAVGERDGSSATWPGRRDLAALYAPGAVIWLDPQGRPTNDARLAIGFLTGAATHGLAPAHYQASAIEARATALDDRATSPSVRAAFDVDLSRNLLRYWRDLHMGRVDPRTVGFRMDGPVDDHDFPAMLREALASRRLREATDALQPPLVLYRSLIQALARYRELAASQPPLSLAAPARSVKPGEQYDELHALGARLEALGDLAARQSAPPLAGVYEGPIVEAVERFQRRHGLESDGVLGRVTIAALDVPLDVRVHQLELALERLRWLPHPGERGFLAVNIPMFHLWGWDRLGDDGVPTFGMDVIVGRALNTQTPVFVEQMRHVIFRPYWNVPPSILRGEVLPAIA